MIKYEKVCRELLDSLPPRTKKIIVRRYGLDANDKETLESIGKDYGITRERVRQIEKAGIDQVKENALTHNDLFTFFEEKIDTFGGLKREEYFLDALTNGEGTENNVVFLLNLGDNLIRFSETEKIHSFWSKEKEIFSSVKITIQEVFRKLKKEDRIMPPEKLNTKNNIPMERFISSIEISKLIDQDEEGHFGLSGWPEINPRGIKDKAYLVVKKKGEPLHFRKVATLIGDDTNSQTVHNELIKDSRFVLVGRGIYALTDWGYVSGEVKDIIYNILKEEGVLPKEEIVKRVEKQRIVKKNTIVQNLSNKKYFIRTPDGKYTLA